MGAAHPHPAKGCWGKGGGGLAYPAKGMFE